MGVKKYLCAIGAANLDIVATPDKELNHCDSNPGKVTVSCGGVARNISENLTLLGLNVELISAFGGDINSEIVFNDCKLKGIGLSHSKKINDESSSMYVCINDHLNDIHVAVASVKILNKISQKFIEENLKFINGSLACIVDANIPFETAEFLFKNSEAKIFLDGVSSRRTDNLKSVIKNIFAIKLNLLEAEILSGLKLSCKSDIEAAAKKIAERNISQIFITLGKDGSYFFSKEESGFIPCIESCVKNTSGAGDAFMSGVVWSYTQGYSISKAAKVATAVSSLCVESQDSVNKMLSCEKLKKIMELVYNE